MRVQGFTGSSYTLESLSVESQRTVNLFPSIIESGRGKEGESSYLLRTPGLSLLATIGNGPIRGIYKASNNLVYAVSGDEFFYIDSGYNTKKIGELNSSSGKVNFADNGTTMVIVDGDNAYIYTLGASTLTDMTDPDWRGSSHVWFIDGYFVFNDPSTGVFYISGSYATTIDALDYATAEGSPDDLLATLVNHREIWLFGENSIEVWYNSGNADFPFTRASGGFIEMGCVAGSSVAKIDKTNFWIGKNELGHGVVYMATGLNPQRISTHAVENAIQSYGDISDAKAWTYQENGHSFYVINFTSANTTWVYDLSTNIWHERAYLNGSSFARHRADCHVFGYNTHIVGDYINGNIYKLDSSVYSDNGQEIKWLRRFPHISQSNKRIRHISLELDMEVGVGLPGNSQGRDPQIMMRFSDDGGYNWSNEKWRSIGKQGNRSTRVKWERLGSSRDRVYEISGSDPVKIALVGANIELEGLAS